MEPPTESGTGRASLGGLLVVAYLLALLHGFALVRALLPRICWVARLERRWIDLWLR
jgi:hypothetical protein